MAGIEKELRDERDHVNRLRSEIAEAADGKRASNQKLLGDLEASQSEVKRLEFENREIRDLFAALQTDLGTKEQLLSLKKEELQYL